MTVLPPNNNHPNNPMVPPPQSHHKTTTTPRSALYLPSIYRYSCQGVFSVSTDTPGSVGTCRGLRSNLEHVLDLDVASRPHAIANFVSQEQDVLVDTSSSSSSNPSANGTTKLLEDKHNHPALVYPQKTSQLHLPVNSTTATANKSKDVNNNKDTVAPPTSAATAVVDAPEEDHILHESWSTYGSTEVECLQLTDLQTGRTEIVAVAPYNHALVSYRNVQMQVDSSSDQDNARTQQPHEQQTHSITCVQIGFSQKLMFLLESNSSVVDETHHHTQEDNGHERQTDNQNNPALPNPLSRQSSPSDWWDHARQNYHTATQVAQRTAAFSDKLLQKMHSNAVWLYDTTCAQPQAFGQKTWQTSQKIAGYMPQTAALLTKALQKGWNNRNNNNNNKDDKDDKDDKGPKPPSW